MPNFDASAPTFDRYRSLPPGVPDAIRCAIRTSITARTRPRVLDLGAGTGRIGKAFVAAGDAYVGVDLSLGMLREFARQTAAVDGRVCCLAQADGEQLPFRDGAFDVVLLIQVLSGAHRWRGLLDEARRVLKAGGNLVVGHVMRTPAGIDAQLKSRLAKILEEMGVGLQQPRKSRDEALAWLRSVTRGTASVVAASWTANRTPREFLARHRTGARFAALAPSIQEQALHRLTVWAEERFGSLGATVPESCAFELHTFESHS
jgi:ubiquinone/menaquinone biosynthesis C-methylase UbiE